MTDRDDVDVHCRQTDAGWMCAVTVRGPGPATHHEVIVAPDDLERLAPADADPTGLVRRSFAFLLEREPKTSILPRFDLDVIGRYFPDWERTIRG